MYCLHKNYHFDVPNWHHHKNSNNMFAWLLTLAIINTFQANILNYSSNPFSTNIPLLYPLKRSENLRFSDVFRGYRSGTFVENGLTLSNILQLLLHNPGKQWNKNIGTKWVNPLSANPPQNGQAHSNNSSNSGDELFECVWPFYGVGA